MTQSMHVIQILIENTLILRASHNPCTNFTYFIHARISHTLHTQSMHLFDTHNTLNPSIYLTRTTHSIHALISHTQSMHLFYILHSSIYSTYSIQTLISYTPFKHLFHTLHPCTTHSIHAHIYISHMV